MSLLVEQRLQAYLDALGVIAEANSLKTGDIAHFRERAIATVGRQFPGAVFLLVREDGQQIMNTRFAPGATLPKRANMDTTRTVFATGKPAVSNLFRAASDGRPIIAIDAPVRDTSGRIVYVVSVNPDLADFADVIRRQGAPGSWVASVFDGNGVNVARVPNADRFIGRQASPSFFGALTSQREGILETTSLEGIPLLTAFSHEDKFGWSVAIGVPRTALTGPALRAALNTLAAGAGLLALSITLALYMARRIAVPIEALRYVTGAINRDQPLDPVLRALPEADEVAQALVAAERERRRSEQAAAVLRDGIETMREGFALYDSDDNLVICNDSYTHLFPNDPDRVASGTKFEAMLRDGIARGHYIGPGGQEEQWIADRVHDHHHPGGTIEQQLADGRWILVSNQPLPNGWLAGLRVDITTLKTALLALADSEERFRLVVEAVPNAIIMVNAGGRIEMVNAQAELVFGYARGELLGQPIEMLVPERDRSHHPGLRTGFFANPKARAMGVGRDLFALRKDGTEFPVEIGLAPITTDAGLMVLSSIIDITTRKLTERQLLDAQHRAEETLAALSTSEGQLRQAQRLAHMGSFVINLRTGESDVSEETCHIFGVPPENADGASESFFQMIHPDDRAALRAARERCLQGVTPEPTEFRIVRPDGTMRRVYNENELILGDDGQPVYLAGTLHDVTEQRRVEEQLRQSQKMEAIGNLTGGMAHDFNNLLGVVIGNLDYAIARISGDADVLEAIGDAHAAAWHGADLTRRLLAFARRQPLRPDEIRVNELITNTVRLLGRLLGEDISVSLELAADTWQVVADPAQLEASLANLATNARDAMPKGGRLMIATANRRLDADYVASHVDVREGDYVLIEVSDTGTGMTPETMSQIFEPFFTTKEQGKGTGLGLSMVFGFMRQSGGHISVYSELDAGTTFRLYLPRATGDGKASEETARGHIERGVGEVVLVVEDNPAVRRAVLRQLRDLGYGTLECERAALALEILEHENVDLLFTDIVMPGGLDGVELARIALERWPKLKVVLTSGFPQTKIDGDGSALKSLRLLSKPYSREELAATLRATLGG